MSLSETAHGTWASSRYSKRKRTQISYYEGPSDMDESQAEQEMGEGAEYSQPKKRKPAARPLPKRRIFPFLELPAEIRNMIYEFCLTDPAGVCFVSTTKKYRRTVERTADGNIWRNSRRYWGSQSSQAARDDVSEPRTLVPSLLAVNKQMYQEGRDFLYGNEIRLADPLTMHSFMVDMGPRAALLLKHVSLVNWGGWKGMHKSYNHSCFAMLASATNLEKFRLEGYLGCKAEPKWVARQMYRDAFPWLEAMGAAKGQLDAAVDVIEIAPVNFARQVWVREDKAKVERDTEAFREELSELLGRRTKTLKSKLGKKRGVLQAT